MARDNLDHFDHDTDARNHPKFKALRASFGWEGVGRFWALNEMVGAATNARLDLSKKVYRATAAEDLGLSIQAFDSFLNFLADPEECGLICYSDGIVSTGKTTENWEALKAYRDKEKARKTSSTGKHPVSSGNDAPSSGNGTNSSGTPAEIRPSSVKSSSVKSREEFDGPGETPTRETDFDPDQEQTPPDDFDPHADPVDFEPRISHILVPPKGLCERFTFDDLDEVQQRFGSRAQEALEIIALKLEAGDYQRFKRPWMQVKTWLAKETSASSWLDKATGKASHSSQAAPVDTRGLNEPPAPEGERVDLGVFRPEDFIRRPGAGLEPRAAGA